MLKSIRFLLLGLTLCVLTLGCDEGTGDGDTHTEDGHTEVEVGEDGVHVDAPGADVDVGGGDGVHVDIDD